MSVFALERRVAPHELFDALGAEGHEFRLEEARRFGEFRLQRFGLLLAGERNGVGGILVIAQLGMAGQAGRPLHQAGIAVQTVGQRARLLQLPRTPFQKGRLVLGQSFDVGLCGSLICINGGEIPALGAPVGRNGGQGIGFRVSGAAGKCQP
jgi:hypothetical protein